MGLRHLRARGQLAAGTAITDSEGEFDVEVVTTGSVSDAFTATATRPTRPADSTRRHRCVTTTTATTTQR